MEENKIQESVPEATPESLQEEASKEIVDTEMKDKLEFFDKYRALSDEYGFDFYPYIEYTQTAIIPKITISKITPKETAIEKPQEA